MNDSPRITANSPKIRTYSSRSQADHLESKSSTSSRHENRTSATESNTSDMHNVGSLGVSIIDSRAAAMNTSGSVRISGTNSHASGMNSTSGTDSHASGVYSTSSVRISGTDSHASGVYSTRSVKISGTNSHASGVNSTRSVKISGTNSHASGVNSTRSVKISGTDSHASGVYSTSSVRISGTNSHASGVNSTSGTDSHASGVDSTSSGRLYAMNSAGSVRISGTDSHDSGAGSTSIIDKRYAHKLSYTRNNSDSSGSSGDSLVRDTDSHKKVVSNSNARMLKQTNGLYQKSVTSQNRGINSLDTPNDGQVSMANTNSAHESISTRNSAHESITTGNNVHESIATRNNVHESIATRNNAHESIATRNNVHESIATRNNVHESIATRNNVHESIATRNNAHESIATRNNAHESIATRNNVHESIATKNVHESIATRNNAHESIATRNNVHESIATRNNAHESIATRNNAHESIATRNNVHESIATRNVHESIATRNNAHESIATRNNAHESIATRNNVHESIATRNVHESIATRNNAHESTTRYTKVNDNTNQPVTNTPSEAITGATKTKTMYAKSNKHTFDPAGSSSQPEEEHNGHPIGDPSLTHYKFKVHSTGSLYRSSDMRAQTRSKLVSTGGYMEQSHSVGQKQYKSAGDLRDIGETQSDTEDSVRDGGSSTYGRSISSSVSDLSSITSASDLQEYELSASKESRGSAEATHNTGEGVSSIVQQFSNDLYSYSSRSNGLESTSIQNSLNIKGNTRNLKNSYIANTLNDTSIVQRQNSSNATTLNSHSEQNINVQEKSEQFNKELNGYSAQSSDTKLTSVTDNSVQSSRTKELDYSNTNSIPHSNIASYNVTSGSRGKDLSDSLEQFSHDLASYSSRSSRLQIDKVAANNSSRLTRAIEQDHLSSTHMNATKSSAMYTSTSANASQTGVHKSMHESQTLQVRGEAGSGGSTSGHAQEEYFSSSAYGLLSRSSTTGASTVEPFTIRTYNDRMASNVRKEGKTSPTKPIRRDLLTNTEADTEASEYTDELDISHVSSNIGMEDRSESRFTATQHHALEESINKAFDLSSVESTDSKSSSSADNIGHKYSLHKEQPIVAVIHSQNNTSNGTDSVVHRKEQKLQFQYNDETVAEGNTSLMSNYFSKRTIDTTDSGIAQVEDYQENSRGNAGASDSDSGSVNSQHSTSISDQLLGQNSNSGKGITFDDGAISTTASTNENLTHKKAPVSDTAIKKIANKRETVVDTSSQNVAVESVTLQESFVKVETQPKQATLTNNNAREDTMQKYLSTADNNYDEFRSLRQVAKRLSISSKGSKDSINSRRLGLAQRGHLVYASDVTAQSTLSDYSASRQNSHATINDSITTHIGHVQENAESVKDDEEKQMIQPSDFVQEHHGIDMSRSMEINSNDPSVVQSTMEAAGKVSEQTKDVVEKLDSKEIKNESHTSSETKEIMLRSSNTETSSKIRTTRLVTSSKKKVNISETISEGVSSSVQASTQASTQQGNVETQNILTGEIRKSPENQTKKRKTRSSIAVATVGNIDKISSSMDVPSSVVQYLTNVVQNLNKTVHELRTEVKQLKHIKSSGTVNKTDSVLKVRFIERTKQTSVYVHAAFLKIGDVDTLKENYIAKICMYARWREPLFDVHNNTYPGAPNTNLDQVGMNCNI